MPGAERVLAVCGWSGSGKTTLLCAAVPVLVDRGLRVAVVKAAHAVTADPPGKDSARLFAAGADVWLQTGEEELVRRHGGEPLALLPELARSYDLVLVEGHKGSPLPKVWVEGREPAPSDLAAVVASLPAGEAAVDPFVRLVEERLATAWSAVPCRAGILRGGASRRMGSAKEGVSYRGSTFVERVLDALEPALGEALLLGGGPSGERRVLPDAPGLGGPAAGIVAAQRWDPDATWLVAACDHPLATRAAVDWLLAERRPGRWAIVPRVDGRPQPLFAVYEPQSARAIAGVAAAGRGPIHLVGRREVATPEPPRELWPAWTDVDTAEELERLP